MFCAIKAASQIVDNRYICKLLFQLEPRQNVGALFGMINRILSSLVCFECVNLWTLADNMCMSSIQRIIYAQRCTVPVHNDYADEIFKAEIKKRLTQIVREADILHITGIQSW